LKGLAANESRNNLEVELLGETPNAEVHRLLESQPFDWMIMLSESEGLPISFAEAMSYGIPVIATDVGGVREEVITGETGILLSAEPSAGELESALCPFFSDIACFLQLRSSTSDFWKANLEESALKRELADILSC